jgi:hypothetical protein
MLKVARSNTIRTSAQAREALEKKPPSFDKPPHILLNYSQSETQRERPPSHPRERSYGLRWLLPESSQFGLKAMGNTFAPDRSSRKSHLRQEIGTERKHVPAPCFFHRVETLGKMRPKFSIALSNRDGDRSQITYQHGRFVLRDSIETSHTFSV